MKTILVILTAAVFGSCYSSSQVQVEMVDAQLVRIDTVFRYETYRSQYPWQREQQLTWRDSYNKQYVSFAAIDQMYRVGTRMTMLRER